MFKFNNLRQNLGIALKFYTSVAKGLKLKVRMFFMFVEVTGEKLVGGGGILAPFLNRLKVLAQQKFSV